MQIALQAGANDGRCPGVAASFALHQRVHMAPEDGSAEVLGGHAERALLPALPDLRQERYQHGLAGFRARQGAQAAGAQEQPLELLRIECRDGGDGGVDKRSWRGRRHALGRGYRPAGGGPKLLARQLGHLRDAAARVDQHLCTAQQGHVIVRVQAVPAVASSGDEKLVASFPRAQKLG